MYDVCRVPHDKHYTLWHVVQLYTTLYNLSSPHSDGEKARIGILLVMALGICAENSIIGNDFSSIISPQDKFSPNDIFSETTLGDAAFVKTAFGETASTEKTTLCVSLVIEMNNYFSSIIISAYYNGTTGTIIIFSIYAQYISTSVYMLMQYYYLGTTSAYEKRYLKPTDHSKKEIQANRANTLQSEIYVEIKLFKVPEQQQPNLSYVQSSCQMPLYGSENGFFFIISKLSLNNPV